MSPSVRAPLATAMALAISVSLALPSYTKPVLSFVLALCVLLFSLGWPIALELPSRLGSFLIIFTTGILALGLTYWNPASWSFSTLMIVVLASAMFISFAHQVFRSDRRQLTVSLSGTMSGALISSTAATWLESLILINEFGVQTYRFVLLLALTATISVLVLSLPIPGRFRIPSQLSAAMITTAILAYYADFSLILTLATLVAALAVSVGLMSSFFLLERVVGVYDPRSYLALSTAPLMLVGIIPVVIIRFIEVYFPLGLS